MRRPPSFVRPQNYRNLSDSCFRLRGFDDEFECEFHTRATQVQSVVKFPSETPHAAIPIAHTRSKKKVNQPCQTRISEIFVEWRHRAGFDATAKAIPQDYFISFTPFSNKVWDFGEIVAVIVIPHDDEGSFGGCDSFLEGRSITALFCVDDARA